MSEVLHRLATKESIDALTQAVEDLPNATQEAADAALAAAAECEVMKQYSFCYFTTPIEIDTVNKTITIRNGFIMTPGTFVTISAAKVVSYTSFSNTSFLHIKTDGTVGVSEFSAIPLGVYPVLMFNNPLRVYSPYGYQNITVDGEPITLKNIGCDLDVFVADNKNHLSNMDNLLGYEDKSVSETGSQQLTTERTFLDTEIVIHAGTYLESIELPQPGNATVKIGLWKKSGKHVSRYYYQSKNLTPENNAVLFPINQMITCDTCISYYVDATNFYGHATEEWRLVPVDNESITDFTYQDGWLLKFGVSAKIKMYSISNNGSSIEVHVGDGWEFDEIQDALDAHETDDYLTIYVHPRENPYSRFSTMRKLTGSYPWNGLATVKHISIVGMDKTKCVIKDDSGNYDTPPAEIATNGIVKNLTFIATHDASEEIETTGSYAVHVDNRPADTNGMKLVFEDCDFVSYQISAVGLGLYKNQDILFDRCNFISHTDESWKPTPSYDSDRFCKLGAFFMHTTMGFDGGNMFIRFRNCFFYHDGGWHAIVIQDADDPQTAYLEAIGNTVFSDNTVGGVYTEKPFVSSNMMQQAWNHGNNDDTLNGQ